VTTADLVLDDAAAFGRQAVGERFFETASSVMVRRIGEAAIAR
jgi:hypothetical protein